MRESDFYKNREVDAVARDVFSSQQYQGCATAATPREPDTFTRANELTKYVSELETLLSETGDLLFGPRPERQENVTGEFAGGGLDGRVAYLCQKSANLVGMARTINSKLAGSDRPKGA